MSLTEPSPPRGPLVTDAVGCVVWWPFAAMLSLVIRPDLGGLGIAATGAALLMLRLAHVSWAAAASGTAGQRLRRAASCRRAEARSPSATSTAWS